MFVANFSLELTAVSGTFKDNRLLPRCKITWLEVYQNMMTSASENPGKVKSVHRDARCIWTAELLLFSGERKCSGYIKNAVILFVWLIAKLW